MKRRRFFITPNGNLKRSQILPAAIVAFKSTTLRRLNSLLKATYQDHNLFVCQINNYFPLALGFSDPKALYKQSILPLPSLYSNLKQGAGSPLFSAGFPTFRVGCGSVGFGRITRSGGQLRDFFYHQFLERPQLWHSMP